MTLQTAANVLAAIKRETIPGVTATATGASQMRIISSPGLELKRTEITSDERRTDGNAAMSRLGGKTVDGSHNLELHVGNETTILLESILRAVFVTATSIPFASMTQVAIGTNSVTGTGGDFIATQNLKVGDIFTISGTGTANDNLRTPITAIGTLTLTVPLGSFVTLAAQATGTITRLRKLAQGVTPQRFSNTIEQYDADIDLSELFLGCRLIGLKFSFKPGGFVQLTASWMGLDRTILTTGTSPWFTSPTVTTGLGLIADDGLILKAGVAVGTFTGFDLDFQITAGGVPVIGTFVSPDVFDDTLKVTGSITGLRSDFSNLSSYDGETEFDLSVLMTELTVAPKPCIGLYLGRVKIGALSAPFSGDSGAKVETLGIIVGPRVAATGFDAGVATFSSSIA